MIIFPEKTIELKKTTPNIKDELINIFKDFDDIYIGENKRSNSDELMLETRFSWKSKLKNLVLLKSVNLKIKNSSDKWIITVRCNQKFKRVLNVQYTFLLIISCYIIYLNYSPQGIGLAVLFSGLPFFFSQKIIRTDLRTWKENFDSAARSL